MQRLAMVAMRGLWLVAGLALGGAAAVVPAWAQALPADLAERAAKRFPQPVRVGDLIGRDVLKPVEAQPVLGHVAAVTRRPDGGLDLMMRTGGVLGFGARTIAVPIEAVALLGEHVAVIDFTPEQLAAFPAADGSAAALPPDETIRVGLVRPFH